MGEYGCFLCGKGKATDLASKCDVCGNPIDVSRELLSNNFGPYKLLEVLGRGYYGYVFLSENKIGTEFALKIVPETLYLEQEKDIWEEVKKYKLSGGHPNIAQLYDADSYEVSLFGRSLKVYLLVTEYIKNAKNLEVFIKKNRLNIDTLVGFSSQICGALSHLGTKDLWHNDLHARNILVSRRPEAEFNHHHSVRYIFTIVDFGSAVFGNPGSVKKRSDIQWLCIHLNTIRKKIYEERFSAELPPNQITFLGEIPASYQSGLDENPSRRPSAAEIWESIDKLWAEYSTFIPWRTPQIMSAFSYPNAIQIPDESYIIQLFSRELPWLSLKYHILGTETNLLLTGPRGCGKTIILRANSLRALMARLSEDETADDRLERVEKSPIIAFFVSCRTTFQIYLATGEHPKWIDDPILSLLFLNLIFAYEMIDTFITASRTDIELLNLEEEEKLLRVFVDQLGDLVPDDLSISYGGLRPLENLRSSLVKLQLYITNENISAERVPSVFRGPQFLSIISNFVSNNIERLRGKKVVFLLDDFTKPIIPEFTQKSLMPIIFNTGGQYSFWVSAHSMSIPKQDLNMVTYDANREYREMNLGREFTTTLENKFEICRSFIDDVFKRRFALSGKYVGSSLHHLLGDSSYGENLAQHIKGCFQNNKRLFYHGYPTIIRLCTGDISYTIDLVGQILARRKEEKPPSKQDQNSIIRIYARQELLSLREIQEVGRDLYSIALWFGKLSRKLLLGELVGRTKKRPAEYLRIELELDKLLTEKTEELLNQLLRHGVFIDGGLGSSRASIPTRVLLYRRIFVPAAPTSLGDRDTFAWNSTKFEKFVRDPESFVEQKAKEAKSKELTFDFDF